MKNTLYVLLASLLMSMSSYAVTIKGGGEGYYNLAGGADIETVYVNTSGDGVTYQGVEGGALTYTMTDTAFTGTDAYVLFDVSTDFEIQNALTIDIKSTSWETRAFATFKVRNSHLVISDFTSTSSSATLGNANLYFLGTNEEGVLQSSVEVTVASNTLGNNTLYLDNIDFSFTNSSFNVAKVEVRNGSTFNMNGDVNVTYQFHTYNGVINMNGHNLIISDALCGCTANGLISISFGDVAEGETSVFQFGYLGMWVDDFTFLFTDFDSSENMIISRTSLKDAGHLDKLSFGVEGAEIIETKITSGEYNGFYSYTYATAIPEASHFAILAGVFTLAFVIYRRRK